MQLLAHRIRRPGESAAATDARVAGVAEMKITLTLLQKKRVSELGMTHGIEWELKVIVYIYNGIL
jgi:hypothetical protein